MFVCTFAVCAKNFTAISAQNTNFFWGNTNMFNFCQMNTNEEDRNKYFGGS